MTQTYRPPVTRNRPKREAYATADELNGATSQGVVLDARVDWKCAVLVCRRFVGSKDRCGLREQGISWLRDVAPVDTRLRLSDRRWVSVTRGQAGL